MARLPTRVFAGAVVAQITLLTALDAIFDVTMAGWLAGTAYALIGYGTLAAALLRVDIPALGPANRVTLIRAELAGCVTALVAEPAPIPVLVAIAAVALVMDAVDGQVARRTDNASPLGARFDLEVDSWLILVLSVEAATSLGPWVLAIGAMRYAFVAAGWVLPWLRREPPPSTARKTVAAAQGVVLLVVIAGLLPAPVATAAVATALAALSWSFVRDVDWLYRNRGDDLSARRAPDGPSRHD